MRKSTWGMIAGIISSMAFIWLLITLSGIWHFSVRGFLSHFSSSYTMTGDAGIGMFDIWLSVTIILVVIAGISYWRKQTKFNENRFITGLLIGCAIILLPLAYMQFIANKQGNEEFENSKLQMKELQTRVDSMNRNQPQPAISPSDSSASRERTD
jgi:hypothetical protein